MNYSPLWLFKLLEAEMDEKSEMKVDEAHEGKTSEASCSTASTHGDADDIIKLDLPPPYPELAETTKEDEEEDKKSVSSKASFDPWDIVEEEDTGTKWKDRSVPMKIWFVIWVTIRILLIVAFLYFFICSLDVLQDAFQLLAGRAASSVFANSVLINNPISALMIGVLVTVLVQSSSTSTSIVVSMVGSGLLTVQQGIPIIMGANIGTTVTNTLVALTQSADRNVFRRAFAGATVHDAFNWLTVFILLPLELATHYLYYLTEAMTANIAPPSDVGNPQFLTAITSPLTELIIMIDKNVITAIAEQSDRQKFPLAEYYCTEVSQFVNETLNSEFAEEEFERVNSMIFTYDVTLTTYNGTNTSELTYTEVLDANSTQCSYVFHGTGMPGALPEPAAGGILLVGSLLVMTFSLLLMVKVLNSLIKGPMARMVRKAVSADFPGCWRYFTGYVALLVGAGVTVIFQSSSVFTSTLTPLVGIGVITVERVYPLTLGSNIGTTVTSVLAALAGDPSKIKDTMQMSFCHLFFNISGILIYYPIPFMRVPIKIAKILGNTTAKYRWFAVFYLVVMFLLFPLVVFGLSLAGWYVLAAVGIPFIILVVFVIVVNVLQSKRPNWLVRPLRTWNWLPKPFRSLEPYDRVLTACCRSKKCCGGRCYKETEGSDSGSDSDTDRSGEGTDEQKDLDLVVVVDCDKSDKSEGRDNPVYDGISDDDDCISKL